LRLGSVFVEPIDMVNFVILCTDQQRADSLGCAGNREARTPNIDALAGRGTRFTRHYTPNQICCPSRGRFRRDTSKVASGAPSPVYPVAARRRAACRAR